MAWLPSVHTALCSFTNTHPNSNGAYLTLYSNYELTTSPTAAYAETVYFDCGGMHNIALQTYHATGQQIFLGQGHHSWYSLSRLSCQAVNMFTIEPLSYGDDRYQLDLNAGWSVVPEGAVRVILLNTGFDGLIYWEHRQAISEDWQGFSSEWNTATKFGISRIYFDVAVPATPSIQWRVKDAADSVIATGKLFNFSTSDQQSQYHINLIGLAGFRTLQTVRSCNVAGSNCNTCPTSSPTKAPTAPTRQPTLQPTTVAQFSYSPTVSPIVTPGPTAEPTGIPTNNPTSFPTRASSSPTRRPSSRPSHAPTLSDAPTSAPTPVPGASIIEQIVVFSEMTRLDDYGGNLKVVCEAGYGASIGICSQNGTFLSGCSVSSNAVRNRRGLAVTFTSSVAMQNSDNAVRLTKSLNSAILTEYTEAASEGMALPVAVPMVGYVQAAVTSTPAPTAASGGGSGDGVLTASLIIMISSAAGILVCILFCWWCRCRNAKHQTLQEYTIEQQAGQIRIAGSSSPDGPPTYRANSMGNAPPTYVQSYIRGDASPNPVALYHGPPTYREEGAMEDSAQENQEESVENIGIVMEDDPATWSSDESEPEFAPPYESVEIPAYGNNTAVQQGVVVQDVGIPMGEVHDVGVPMVSLNPIALNPDRFERSIDSVVGVPDPTWLSDLDMNKRE